MRYGRSLRARWAALPWDVKMGQVVIALTGLGGLVALWAARIHCRQDDIEEGFAMSEDPRNRSHLSSFLVAAAAAFLSVSCSTSSNTVVGAGDEVDALSVCEAMQNSASLRNSIVRVRGRVISGFEVFALVSDECRFDSRLSAMIWLETPSSNDSEYADGPSLSEFARAAGEGRLGELERSRTWTLPIPVTFLRDEQWRRMHRRSDSGRTVHATFTGRLDFAPANLLLRSPNGRLSLSGGFGHMNGYSRRLIIQRVESVD